MEFTDCSKTVANEGEFRMYGPPGTGKTTWLKGQIEKAAEKHGSDSVLVASFTRAAARVLVGRELPIPDSAIGTLHAHCYRALGRPKIADAYLKEFGEAANMLLTGTTVAPSMEDMPDVPTATTQDDDSYLEYSRLRNLMVPREAWPESVRSFARLWEQWKKEHDMMDFTDLIEVAARDMLYAPGNAQVGFFDEAQDSTPLQHKLMRAWGKNMRFFILAGDDDQCLYSFLGAHPETLVGEFPAERKLFLRQSWRVPRQVQTYAEHVIAKVSRRQIKEYLPRDEEGSVETSMPARWKSPVRLVSRIEQDMEQGLSVMVIAPCAYALGPTIKELKRIAVPFANPLRTNRGDWNPLALSPKRESALGRVRDFIQPKHELRLGDDAAVSRIWSAKQLIAWIKLINHKEFFGKGFKARLKVIAETGQGDSAQGIFDLLCQYGQDLGYLSQMVSLCSKDNKADTLAILRANFLPESKIIDSTDYAMRCVEKAGGDFEKVDPRVCIGTIHSVKGGQADSVYIIPDVPAAVYQSTLHSREEYDASIRLAYVAITRAKMKVSVLVPETRFTLRGLFS